MRTVRVSGFFCSHSRCRVLCALEDKKNMEKNDTSDGSSPPSDDNDDDCSSGHFGSRSPRIIVSSRRRDENVVKFS